MAVTDICLKWNNHHNNLVSCLYSQLANKIVADVTIAAEGKCINVHRLLLCASSTYFESLLGQFDKPAVLILQTVTFSDVQLLVEYMYKGEVSLSKDQLDSFLVAANCLQIKGLIFPDGHNSTHVQEELPITPDDLSLDSTQPIHQADDFYQTEMLDFDENLNQQEIQPAPLNFNLDDLAAEQEQTPPDQSEMETINEEENQDCNSILNSTVDEDLLKSDSEEEVVGEKSKLSTRQPKKEKDSNGKVNLKQSQTSSQPIKCGTCDREFQTTFKLQQHTLKRNCPSYFRCALCGKSISKRSYVRQHISSLHRNVESSQFDEYIIQVEPTFACDLCSHRCKDRASLLEHKKKKHDGIKLQVRHTFGGF